MVALAPHGRAVGEHVPGFEDGRRRLPRRYHGNEPASPTLVTGSPRMHTPSRARVALAAPLALAASLLPIGLRLPLDSPSGAARAAIIQPYAAQGQLPVAPGVTHDWGTMATGSGQQVVNLVEVQPNAPGISFDAALSNDQVLGLEQPSSEANRKSVEGHRAIAAVNGDVWSGSSVGANAAPNGIDIENGELEVAGNSARPTFGIDGNGQPLIGAPLVTTNLITPDGVVHPINRINQHRNAGEYVLYTPRFGAQTDAEGSGTEVVLTGVPLPLGTPSTPRPLSPWFERPAISRSIRATWW